MSKGGEVGEMKEVIVTEKQQLDTSHAVTRRWVYVQSVARSEGRPWSLDRTLKRKRDRTRRGCIQSPSDVC